MMAGMRFLLAILLFAVAACGSPAPPAAAPSLGFTGTTVDGAPFDGAALAGEPAVLWFWAPWCTKCQREAAGVAEVAEQTGVRFVGVAANDTVEAMRGFIEERGVGGFEHLADPDAALWRHFGVIAQPAYAFVSSSGAVEVVTDQLPREELLAKADALG